MASSAPTPSHRRRLVVVSLLVLACVAVAALQAHARHRYDAAVIAQQVEQDRRAAANRRAQLRVQELGWEMWREEGRRVEVTLEEIERQLNGGRPLEIRTERGEQIARYVDDRSGGEVRLLIRDRRLITTDPFRARIRRLPDANAGLHGMVMMGRRRAYLALYAAWVVVALVVLVQWRRMPRRARMEWAQRAVVIALVATFLAFLGRRGWRDWSTFNQDDSPGWGLVFIMVSGVVLWLASRRVHGGDSGPSCEACGYNLTGNVSGVCPECGTPVGAGAGDHGRPFAS